MKSVFLLAALTTAFVLAGCSGGSDTTADAGPAPTMGGKFPPVSMGGGKSAAPSTGTATAEAK